MLFVGDVAVPDAPTLSVLEKTLAENAEIFKKNSLVFNLEGMVSEKSYLSSKEPILYNHPQLLEMLSNSTDAIACLANNHVLDLPELYLNTVEHLERSGIMFTGAAMDSVKARVPVFFKEGDYNVIILNACWGFLLYHQKNPSKGVYVNEIDEKSIIKQVVELRNEYPNSKIVIGPQCWFTDRRIFYKQHLYKQHYYTNWQIF